MTKAADSAPPRPRNSTKTKARILEAAQNAFSTRGYRDVGIRDISAAAEVNQNLITRYFGGKASLFREALASILKLDDLLIEDRADFGNRQANILRENHATTMNSGAMLALSIGDPQARAISSEKWNHQLVDVIADWLDGPDAKARARLISMLSMGFTVVQLLTAEESEESREEQIFIDQWLAETLQKIVDMPEGSATGTLPSSSDKISGKVA
ncbi:TetR/AcrR family transcriptional regulator [Sphingobium phenoxybenzoativorans]|uniref:TetR/AcrR family transcriptional regulator n=1 Tax=Sphingobium phenoxybenzoativorans TaxID=1592790 RepID=UPI000872E3CD|nr:TetR family transcriptional regulator [Sphingobium phenoxybenzoativorans]